jgi:hypothetical protein
MLQVNARKIKRASDGDEDKAVTRSYGIQVGSVSRIEERVVLQDKTTGRALLQWHLNIIDAPLENLLDFPSR